MRQLGNGKSYWKVSRTDVDMRRTVAEPNIVTIDAQPQRLTFDLNHTAVIVVDMQNDFCSEGGWVDYIGGDFAILQQPVRPLNRLLPKLRSSGVPVIWLNWGNREDRLNVSPSVLHVYNGDGEGRGIGDPLPYNESRVLEKGSWGAAIVSGLQVEAGDIHVDKFRMSGFWDTHLDSILRNMDIHTVLFTGVNLDQCVMATLQDAVNSGYDCILLKDCCATNSPSFCTEATIYNIKQCYGFVADSATLLEAIKQKKIERKVNMSLNNLVFGHFEDCPVYKISPKDTNKFVLLCDREQVPFVSVVEIFDEGGKTPPNEHAEAYEYFYVLAGEGIAVVGDKEVEIRSGSFFVVPPGNNHRVSNTGKGRLYVLTTMIPDEKFSDLIKSGPTARLDEEDLAVLRGIR